MRGEESSGLSSLTPVTMLLQGCSAKGACLKLMSNWGGLVSLLKVKETCGVAGTPGTLNLGKREIPSVSLLVDGLLPYFCELRRI